jgi:hypothetical protein
LSGPWLNPDLIPPADEKLTLLQKLADSRNLSPVCC